jgi:hypothetical protein
MWISSVLSKSPVGRLSAYNASPVAKMIGVRHCVSGRYEGKKHWSVKIGS